MMEKEKEVSNTKAHITTAIIMAIALTAGYISAICFQDYKTRFEEHCHAIAFGCFVLLGNIYFQIIKNN